MAMRRENVAAALRYLGDKADLRRRAERMVSLDPQEQDLADIAVETGASFVPGVGQALAARDVERARRANDPAGMAMAAAGAIPGGKLAKLLKGFDPTRLELDVYHGTPHRFPATEANPLGEFDASKIGTGEGAQAYGHGIYLAESPGVAESYKQMSPQMLPVGKYAPEEEMAYYAGRMVRQLGSPEKVLARLEGKGGKAQEIVEAIKDGSYKPFYDEVQQSSLYKADLPDEMIDRMLDWDKPLSEQHPEVQRIIGEEIKRIGGSAHTGERAYRELMFEARMGGKKSASGVMKSNIEALEASKRLQELGIPGIKYLDAGSRGQGGIGTRNFVVFPGEEKKVQILRRSAARD